MVQFSLLSENLSTITALRKRRKKEKTECTAYTQQDSISIANWCCFIVHKKRLHFSYVYFSLLLFLYFLCCTRCCRKHSTASSESSVVYLDVCADALLNYGIDCNYYNYDRLDKLVCNETETKIAIYLMELTWMFVWGENALISLS